MNCFSWRKTVGMGFFVLFVCINAHSANRVFTNTAASPGADLIAPCDPSSPPKYLRSCDTFLPEVLLDPEKGFIHAIEQRMEKVYADKVMPSVTDPAYGCTSHGNDDTVCGAVSSQRIADEVCSLTPNRFDKNQVEKDTNHLGRNCGEYMGLLYSVNSGGSKYTYIFTEAQGSKERAWLAGAFVQAVAYHLEKVKTEVQTGKKLKVSGVCQPIATDLAALATKSNELADVINQNLEDQGNIKDIWNCRNDWAPKVNKEGVDPGKIRQSAQQLCAARDNLEGMFRQLMVCETFSRAGKDYRGVFGTNLNQVRALLDANVATPCKDRCKQQCDNSQDCSGCRHGCCNITGCHPNWGRCSSCGQSCGTNCYQNGFPVFPLSVSEFLKNLILSHWKI